MASRRKAKHPAPLTREEEEIGGFENPDEQESDSVQAQILDAIGEQASGFEYIIKVYAIEGNPKAGGVEKFLFPLQPQDLGTLEEYLCDRYGTGAFRVRVRAKNLETGRESLFRVWTVHTMAPPRRPWAAPTPQGVSDAPATGDLAAVVTAAIQQQGEANASLMRELFTRTAPAQATPLSEVCAMFETFQKMSAPAQPVAPVAPAQDATTALDLFMKGIDFARDTLGGGSASGEGDWKDVLRDVIRSPVVRAIGERIASPAAPQALDATEHAPPNMAPRLPLHQAPAPRPAPPTLQLQTELAAGIVRDLIAYARAGVDPAATLDYIDEMLPGGMIRQICSDDSILEQLMTLVPEAQAHRGFFAALQQVIRAEYREADSDASPSAPPDARPKSSNGDGRDAGDTKDNATPAAGGADG